MKRTIPFAKRNNTTGMNSKIPIDKAAYYNLEQRFRAQVDRDRVHAIERVVEGWGVYLPCAEPTNQVDYLFVAMEPSFNWAGSIEAAEKKIENGFRNFAGPYNPSSTLALFICSIKRFLCRSGESYHLTDVSKGAMPGYVADIDRDRRYEDWFPLLLEEIEIVSKPGTPVIAIGREVERFLRRSDLKGKTGRPSFFVPHYSMQAAGYFRREAEKDPKGFEEFEKTEFGAGTRWPTDLSLAKKRLVFSYKKRFGQFRH